MPLEGNQDQPTIQQPQTKKPIYKRWWFLTPIIALTAIILFVVVIVLFVPDPDAPAGQSSSTNSDVTLHPVGQAIEAPGVTLTVNSVTRSDTIEQYAEGYKRGYKPNETTTADNGGEFISVTTTVKNTDQNSMDLTCGFGVRAVLVNTATQSYDPVKELYRLIDNPECNDNLNPGFEAQMTWTYLVPKGTEIGAFGFANPDVTYDDLQFVDVRNAA